MAERVREQRTEEPQDGGDELSSAFERSVEEGEHRLNRTWAGLLATGAVGGVDIGLGVFGLLLVLHATGNTLLAGLAFSIGFIVLVLANSELFTEDFLIPIMAASVKRASWRSVGRLWTGTLAMNIVGGWIVMAVIIGGFPELRPDAVAVGEEVHAAGYGWTSFASAIFAGMLMTLLTWMERATASVPGKLAAAVAIGFLLGAGRANHAVINSLEMFGALHAGAPFGYLDWLGVLGWSAFGNIIGGVGLVTTLRLVQVGATARERTRERREQHDHEERTAGRTASNGRADGSNGSWSSEP